MLKGFLRNVFLLMCFVFSLDSYAGIEFSVDGKGFFILADHKGKHYYTSSTEIVQNRYGEWVKRTGHGEFSLLAFPILAGAVSSSLVSVNVANLASLPVSTKTVSLTMNLDPWSEALEFDGSSFANAYQTSNFSVPHIAYDSFGTQREIVLYFVSEPARDHWEYYILTLGENLHHYAEDQPEDGTVIIASGEFQFDRSGFLESVKANYESEQHLTGTLEDIAAGERLGKRIKWISGKSVVHFTLDLGQSSGSAAKTTQLYTSQGSSLGFVEQDGLGVGELLKVVVEADGLVKGIFSNGDKQAFYQIPLARFMAPEYLFEIPHGLLIETAGSGFPAIGQAASTSRGRIVTDKNDSKID